MIDVNIVTKDETKDYPRLMRLKDVPDFIVYFESERCGYQLTGSYSDERFCAAWSPENFEDFTGTLELRNV